MSAVGAFFRRRSLRVRITFAFVAASALLALVLSTVTYFAVRNFLEDQRVRSATRQTLFGLAFAREFAGPGAEDAQELVSLLQTRGNFDAMVTVGDDWFSTTLTLTPASVPSSLRALVVGERLGYEFHRFARERVVVFGAPLPPAGTDLYLFYTLGDLDQTMRLLARVLFVAGLAVVLLSLVTAQSVSRRIVAPLSTVSSAAQRVAEGLLETRVEAESADEVGTLAASFNQMAAAFQEMIDRERRFVASVSHELRTPLAALHATTETLGAHRDALPPAGVEAVDLVREDVEGLRRLVEELLEISELDSPHPSMRWERVDLRALADAIVARRRRGTVVEGDPVETVADKSRLERIVSNLLDNAHRHGNGADVRLTLRRVAGEAVVAVSDRGPGLPVDDIPHLFDRFYKVDRSRSRDQGGIGLGLAIALQNARLHGGSIEAGNRDGGGAVFTLRLPIRHEAPEG